MRLFMIQDPFAEGQLLLPQTPPEPVAAEGTSFVGALLVVISVLLFLLILRSFLSVLPYLLNTVLRARGSANLENSVRVSRDRNLVALVLVLPAILLIYRYRLYDPDFVQGLSPDMRLLVVGGVFIGFLLLRHLLTLWARPRRRYDDYQMAYHTGHTFFILQMMLALLTVGVTYLLDLPDLTVKSLLLLETAVVYGIYLLRRGQILSLSCNPLTTFLYLCGLELLPAAALVASAVIL